LIAQGHRKHQPRFQIFAVGIDSPRQMLRGRRIVMSQKIQQA
jgi:hypothetical protein